MTGRQDNRDLAERARAAADRSPRGSLACRALGVVSVALSTTRSVGAASKVLAGVEPAELRAEALRLLGTLRSDPENT